MLCHLSITTHKICQYEQNLIEIKTVKRQNNQLFCLFTMAIA